MSADREDYRLLLLTLLDNPALPADQRDALKGVLEMQVVLAKTAVISAECTSELANGKMDAALMSKHYDKMQEQASELVFVLGKIKVAFARQARAEGKL